MGHAEAGQVRPGPRGHDEHLAFHRQAPRSAAVQASGFSINRRRRRGAARGRATGLVLAQRGTARCTRRRSRGPLVASVFDRDDVAVSRAASIVGDGLCAAAVMEVISGRRRRSHDGMSPPEASARTT